jgi:hypothetical protein
VTELRTARATDRPCRLYAYHVPVVVQTEAHHRHPVYLQRRVWGEVRDHETLDLCGNCHSATHEAIGWLLGESRRPSPMPGRNVLREAERTVEWFRSIR